MNNLHNKNIPTDVLKQVADKFSEINTLLKPYLITLTPDDRKYMLKKGDKSDSFVNKAFEYTKTNPEFMPQFLNASDFEIDITDANNLIGISAVSTQICDGLSDTATTAGSEAYYAALAYYNSVQMAVSQNVPGAKAIHEELKKRFPGKSRGGESTATAK
jgi:hypothetical protein